jgi:hypothetical protein
MIIILPRELEPQVCVGWWEEQCFALHAIGSTAEPTELIDRFGKETAKLLWDTVSRETVQWLRNCHFGFFELDCLLIHGSRVIGVGNVGREVGKATYTLYNPNSDRLEFKTVYYGSKKGFRN